MKRFLSFVLPFVLAFVASFAAHGSTTNISGATRISGDISPSQLTAQTDNWNPTGLSGATVIRVSTDASRDLTGLAGGYDGRLIVIHNVGAQDLVLKDASGSSSAANRFALTGDITLAADAVALLQYDGTTSVWRLVGGSGSGGIAHSSLTGLTSGDDHTQYALLAGRSGGQTLIGGTAAGNDLTLKSTSNASKGSVIIQGTSDFILYDPTDTSVINLRHTGTDAIFESSAGDIHVQPAGGDVKIFDAGYAQSLNLKHDATDATVATSTGDILIQPAGGNVLVYDTGPTNYLDLRHDGTDGLIATNAGDLKLNPSTGFVGINKTSPAFPLDVATGQSNTARFYTTSDTATGCSIHVIQDSASPADSDKVGTFFFLADDDTATQRVIGRIAMQFDDVTSTTMDSSMIFSTQDAANAVDYNKNATLTSLGVWTDASLAAGKTFEGKLPDVLDKVKNLRIEKYRSSNVPANSPDLAAAERHYSCTAEDFYAVFGLGKDPSQTHTDENGNTYKTGGIAPKDAAFLALDCIQKLIAENEALKARVAALEAAKP